MVRLIAIGVVFCLSLAAQGRAASFLSLDKSEYPAAVNDALQQVRSACKESGHQPLDYPGIGVTIIDLNRDGSKDIVLRASQACDFPTKGAGCNTAGCVVQIFKQVGNRKWRMIFDETLGTELFLSASNEGYFHLMAISVSRKITSRCPNPSDLACDYLLYWKKNKFIWERIR
jgi:hypothetical protein